MIHFDVSNRMKRISLVFCTIAIILSGCTTYSKGEWHESSKNTSFDPVPPTFKGNDTLLIERDVVPVIWTPIPVGIIADSAESSEYGFEVFGKKRIRVKEIVAKLEKETIFHPNMRRLPENVEICIQVTSIDPLQYRVLLLPNFNEGFRTYYHRLRPIVRSEVLDSFVTFNNSEDVLEVAELYEQEWKI